MFTNLAHYNPVRVCPPHRHRFNATFNHNCLDALDYALTSIFSSSLITQVRQVEGPLILESIRDSALSVLFKRKIDKNWDASSKEARTVIDEILHSILGTENLRKTSPEQPLGNNALAGALLEARSQIVSFETSPILRTER